MKAFVRHRLLLKHLVKRGIQSKYSGSVLGLIWGVLTPLFMLAVYTVVFSMIFGVRPAGNFSDSQFGFAIFLLCGLTFFNVFSETLSQCGRIIVGNTNYVKRVVFPLELLPLSVHLVSCALNGAWLLIVLAGVVFLGNFTLAFLCLPLVLVAFSLFTLGLSWFVASLAVFVRDLPHFIDLLLRALFFLTPILYTLDQVPASIRWVIQLNPLSHVVEQSRRMLLMGEWPHFGVVLSLNAVGLLSAYLGYHWFMRTKKGFADVL